MRDKPGIADERLLTCLRECYRIEAKTLEFLPLGKDTYAGIYRAESVEGVAYALKVKFGAFYEASCQAPRYLREQGIASVVAPLATMDGVPWARLDDGEGWTLAVYPFIAGERGWEPPLTEAQWSELGAIFRAIHQVAPPPQGGIPSMRRERFDPTEYRRAMLRYDAWLAASESGDVAEQGLHMRWEQYRERVEATQATMERLAEMLQVNAATYVICHADLHPGNLLRNAEDMFVIDWDDVMLAPKEHDFLFVGDPPVDGASVEDAPPFFRGYGATETDWAALTYYRCERVVTDVLVSAEEVLFRDDLSAEIRSDAVLLLDEIFAVGSSFEWARTTAANLPPGLHALG